MQLWGCDTTKDQSGATTRSMPNMRIWSILLVHLSRILFVSSNYFISVISALVVSEDTRSQAVRRLPLILSLWEHDHFPRIKLNYNCRFVGLLHQSSLSSTHFSIIFRHHNSIFNYTLLGKGSLMSVQYPKQNRESTEEYSKCIVRKNNDKFGKWANGPCC